MTETARVFVPFDLETHCLQPGLAAPPVVCASTIDRELDEIVSSDLSFITDYLERALASPEIVLVGANIPYDFACMGAEQPDLLPAIFAKYRAGGVWDVQVAEMLHAISRGELGLDPRTGKLIKPEPGKKRGWYSLRYCVDLRLGRDDAKRNDFWRLRYAYLEGIPVELWPEEAREYPKDDARNPLECAIKQVELGASGDMENLWNMREQARTAFALQLSSVWGLRVHRSRYEALRDAVEENREAERERFRAMGFVADNDKKDGPEVKRRVALAYGADSRSSCPRCSGAGQIASTSASALKSKRPKMIGCKVGVERAPDFSGTAFVGCDSTGLDLSTAPTLPRTDSGGVSTSRDTLVESGDEELMEFSHNQLDKLHGTYLPYLAAAVDAPMNPRANILVETGRVSYEGVVQLLPRQVRCPWCRGKKCDRCSGKGTISGVRECHVARPGYVFSSVDFGAGELCTLAQVNLWLFGYSEMARIINESGDPSVLHLSFAADLLGMPLGEAAARYLAKDLAMVMARQGSKAGNFGFGGGMGAAKFVINKRDEREGFTRSLDGEVIYPGLRFCILVGGEERCGATKIVEWKGRTYSPMCRKCVEVAEDMRGRWFKKFGEMRDYHRWCQQLVEEGGRGPCFRPCWECGGARCAACEYRGWTVERWRGGMDFSTTANNGFQALLADAAKAGYSDFSEESYTDRASPAFGSRPVGFYHDEMLAELPIYRSHAAAYRQAEVMLREGRRYVPDVTMVAKPALSKFWCKGAEEKFDAAGQLVPWDMSWDEVYAVDRWA